MCDRLRHSTLKLRYHEAMNSQKVKRRIKQSGTRRLVPRLAIVASAALAVACGTSAQTPGRSLTEVKSCGTVLYSGYAGVVPTRISSPTPSDKASAPAPVTALPPLVQNQSPKAGEIILQFTSNCEIGDQVAVTPLNAVQADAVAHSKNGGISGVALSVSPQTAVPVTVYDYRDGQLVGIVHIAG
jgi:hypothetical protein